MKKFLIALIFISLTVNYAQTSSIKGRVISDKNEPLGNVNVIVLGKQLGAMTMNDGSFEIKNLPFGEYILEVSIIGYSKKTFSLSLSADTKPITIILNEEAVQAEQIVVSAGKYEQKVQDLSVSAAVITPDLISRKNYLTFDDMLRYIPGVQMNLEQVSIRGSSGYSKGAGARVLVAVNSIPMYSGDTGDIVWELIPIADIERIEIIKGPASSLYGTTAIGGVINVVTKSSVKNPVTYFRSYVGGYDKPAYDFWRWNNKIQAFYGIELTHSNSIENLGYTFSFKKFDNMSYRQNDYAKRYLGYVKLNYDFPDGNRFTFFADFLNMDRGNFLYWKDSRNALVPKDEDNGNKVKSNRLFSGLIYHHRFSKNVAADFKSSYYYTKFDGYGIELTTSTANLFRNELIANMILSDVVILTSGVEALYSKVSSNIFKNPKFFSAGAYSQVEYKGIANLIATVGARYDYIKLDTLNSANAVTPKAGLNYKLTKDFILRASFGTGFRAPTPSEVFTTAAVGGGINVKENPDLKSETSISVETGAIYNYSKDLSFDLALFQTDYKNFIEPNLTKEGKIQFVNLSKARIQGVELRADWSIFPNELKVTTGYNYTWARDVKKNAAMKYRPRNIVYSQIRYSPHPFDFAIDFRYWSKVEEIDYLLTQPPLALIKDGDKRVPVYVTDISAGYNFLLGNIPAKIYANAKNIFNYNYVEFIGNIAQIRNYSLSFEIFF